MWFVRVAHVGWDVWAGWGLWWWPHGAWDVFRGHIMLCVRGACGAQSVRATMGSHGVRAMWAELGEWGERCVRVIGCWGVCGCMGWGGVQWVCGP